VSNRTALFARVQPGGVFTVEDVREHPGNIWFVNSGAAGASDSVGAGKSPDIPFATLDYAIAFCTANNGDVIYVMPGHAQTLTTLVAVDVAGVSIIGLGQGTDAPEFTVGANIDGISVTVDNVLIENLRFPVSTAAHTANINVAAASCTIRKCFFLAGQYDIDAVTVTADGEKFTFEDNIWIVTADGPDDVLLFEGVVDLPVVRRNRLVGCDGTNACDDGILNFGGFAITNPIVVDNVFDGADQATTVMANVASLVGDCVAANKYAGSAVSADTVTTNAATIGAGAITTASFGAGAIDAAAIAANAIGASEIADAAIDAATFAAGAITAAAIATDAIDADALAADAVDEIIDEALAAHHTQNTVGGALASTEMCCEKTDGAVLLGDDPIFTIAGGPIHILEIAGIVTTVIGGGATNAKLELDTTSPAATVQMNAGAVDIDSDAAGTSYRSINTTGVFTPVTAGFVLQANAFAVLPTEYFAPAGTIMFNSDAARSGVIHWYLRYRPMSPNSVVTAAA
jgi:hypothetical protein